MRQVPHSKGMKLFGGSLFDALVEDGEVTLGRPWDVPPQMWEDLQKQKPRSDFLPTPPEVD